MEAVNGLIGHKANFIELERRLFRVHKLMLDPKMVACTGIVPYLSDFFSEKYRSCPIFGCACLMNFFLSS